MHTILMQYSLDSVVVIIALCHSGCKMDVLNCEQTRYRYTRKLLGIDSVWRSTHDSIHVLQLFAPLLVTMRECA